MTSFFNHSLASHNGPSQNQILQLKSFEYKSINWTQQSLFTWSKQETNHLSIAWLIWLCIVYWNHSDEPIDLLGIHKLRPLKLNLIQDSQ